MIVRVGAAVAAGSALLSVLVGISRTAQAMARGRDLPRCLAAVGPRGTPWPADLIGGVMAALIAALAGPAAAIALSACSVLVYYAVINLAALRLHERGAAALDRRSGCAAVRAARPPAAAGPGADHRGGAGRGVDGGDVPAVSAMMSDMSDLLTGPLHDRHTALGATLGAFGGWSMPINYPDGTVAEHTAVRTDVGVFDVSHLGKLAITGPGAAAFVNRCFTADLDKIGPGKAQYTLCCNASGGVLDDVIVYLNGPDDVLAVPNAANAAHVADLLRAAAPAGITVVDRHRDLAVLAVQGPRSGALVPADLDYMAFVDRDGTRICRTGYTGEHGYELLVPWDAAGEVWDGLVAAGARPCGLGARDTLRPATPCARRSSVSRSRRASNRPVKAR